MIHRTGKRAKHTTKPYTAENKTVDKMEEEDDDTLVDKEEVSYN